MKTETEKSGSGRSLKRLFMPLDSTEPEECLGAALYLLQLVQQDLNMSRKATVWARVKRAREHLAQLEADAFWWAKNEFTPPARGPEPQVKHRANAKRHNEQSLIKED